MSWHPLTTQDVARLHDTGMRVEVGRARRAPSPRFRASLAGRLRLLANRLDGGAA